MSRDINPYALRLPPLLKKVLKETAHDSRRSLNAEIVSRLEESLIADGITWEGSLVSESSKVYEVEPSASTKVKFNRRYTKKGVDNLMLATAITAGEKYIEEQKAVLPITKRALLFAILYDLIDDESDDYIVSNETIDMLLKLAS